jgi:hypothetical protein
MQGSGADGPAPALPLRSMVSHVTGCATGGNRGCVISDASAAAIGAGATARADGTGANAYAQAGGEGNCRAVGSSACEDPGNNFNVAAARGTNSDAEAGDTALGESYFEATAGPGETVVKP